MNVSETHWDSSTIESSGFPLLESCAIKIWSPSAEGIIFFFKIKKKESDAVVFISIQGLDDK